jgi:hypothetical protein
MAAYKKAIRDYRFMDKDPVKDELQTVLQDVGLFSRQKLRQVAILANRAPATLDNLFFGSTKRPQNATIAAILEGIGYERVMQQVRVIKDLDGELKQARAANKAHKARKAKAAAKPRQRKKGWKPRVVKGGRAA